jgi:hypothetical protein
MWQLVNFKLQKLELFKTYLPTADVFENFMKNQTSLKELSLSHHNVTEGITDILMKLPSLQQINITLGNADGNTDARPSIIDMSSIPHQHLSKFKLCNCYYFHRPRKMSFCDRRTSETEFYKHHLWRYAPEDVDAFQRDVLAFLDKDSDIQDVKHSEMIESAMVGRGSWLEAGVGLSNEFIESLIMKMPSLKRLWLYSDSNFDEIKRIVGASGRDFEVVKIFTRNGNMEYPNYPNRGEYGERDSFKWKTLRLLSR